MSNLLYNTFKEYIRVVEDLSMTEVGIFIKGRVPDDYGGPIIDFSVVHIVHMVDLAGTMQTLEFHNVPPLNKDKTTKVGVIKIDGATPAAPALGSGAGSGGDARTWVSRKSTVLASEVMARGDITYARRTKAA